MDARTQAIMAAGFSAILLLTGCGMSRRLAISSMTPIVEQTVESVYRDRDIETVREAIPGNLMLIRGLCESNPGDRKLCALATQLYFYYAVGFIEDEDPERATLLYQQGRELGTKCLARRGWFHPEGGVDRFITGLEKAGDKDLPLLFWTVANWTRWISLNLGRPAAVAQLPYAEATLDRVLEIDPDYFLGMPHAMRGTLEASTPVLMGGDPESAKRHFDQAFEISGRKLLIFNVFYAQYYCRMQLDAEEFEAVLQEVLDADLDDEPDYRLLNEVARRKAMSLMERKDDLF